MRKVTVEICEFEIHLLANAYESWGELSSNPNDTASMTDHCHLEADALISLVSRATEALERLDESYKNVYQTSIEKALGKSDKITVEMVEGWERIYLEKLGTPATGIQLSMKQLKDIIRGAANA